MPKFWDFFENLNEMVYVADTETHELIYMNKKLRETSGLNIVGDYHGQKCYKLLQNCSEPCAMCTNCDLKVGQFKEWWYYNPVIDKNVAIKDTLIEEDGKLYRLEIAIDIQAQKWAGNVVTDQHDLEALANEAVRVALKKSSPDDSIAVFLEYLGKALGGDRTYVFEKNENGNDSNTYEWVAAGIEPAKDTLQDIPPHVFANWYRQFKEDQSIVITDLESVRAVNKDQYETLKRQNIHSLYVVPLYDNTRVIGFYGLDNPSSRYQSDIAEILMMVSHYIVSAIRRRNLIIQLQREELEEAAAYYQREISEALARQTQENLDMVNDIIGSGLWHMEFDEEGHMEQVVWSDKFRQMLDYQDENDFPNTLEAWIECLHPDERLTTLHSYEKALKEDQTYDVKHRLKKKNGEYEWFHTRGKVARWPNGNPRLFLGTFINITLELKAQQALEDAYQAANRANSAKTDFMANMSHDIRTPLNAIIGMTAIAAMHLQEPERLEHCLAEITASSRHLLELVNEVLDMNKIESGTVSLNIEAFKLSELLDDVVAIAKPLIFDKNHDFNVVIKDIRHESVYGDRQRLQQCLVNLLSNAVKYTPAAGKIRLIVSEKVTNRPRRGCFEFIVEDNGIGMTEEFIEKIFEPFARADDSRVAKLQGTGLGMAITRNIVQMMNGDVKVESTLHQGSRFTMTVFLELEDAEDEKLDDELLDLPILIADDEYSARENACRILRDLGMKPDAVDNGVKALNSIIRHHEEHNGYFAAILDWKMPDMTGIETTRAIREAIGDEMPIIVISAYDWTDIEKEARAAGANAFINKPLFKSKLVYVMRTLIGKAREYERAVLDDIAEADFTGHRVLLVEDNDLNAEIAMEILAMSGLEVDHAWNGEEALNKLKDVEDGYYDLVFMDIQMPVLDGYQATMAIRSSSRHYFREVPIIAMSANAFAEDVQRSKQAGMNDHIPKPLDFDRLLTTLSRWILL